MELYWLLRLPHLHSLFECFGYILLVLTIPSLVFFVYSYIENDFLRFRIFFKIMAPLGLIFAILSCFIPTKTDLALMLGWDALKSENVQEVIEILKDKIK